MTLEHNSDIYNPELPQRGYNDVLPLPFARRDSIESSNGLATVSSIGNPRRRSETALDHYMDLRSLADEQIRPQDDELDGIKASVGEWIESEGILPEVPNYVSYDQEAISKRFSDLAAFLKDESKEIPDEDFEATEVFVGSAFGIYHNRNRDGSPAVDGDGSFAFIVPARMSRKNPEYGEEVEPVIPLMRYVPNELRAEMLVGLPPFVIDTYQRDQYHRRGYLIYTPVSEDMEDDLPAKKAMELARMHVNNAVDFAVGRFGVEVVGLGATLPALTRYGTTITNPNVVTTTGHGGTTYLIKETVAEGIRRGYTDGKYPPSIGALGLGTIGASIAELIATEFPDSELTIYDEDASRTAKSAESLRAMERRFKVAGSDRELIEESTIIISAIVGKIDLKKMQGISLEDKFIVDDSQPGSFDPAQVRELGGKLAWVVGRDSSHNVMRRGYDYGTLVDGNSDLFGCEAEAASLVNYKQMLIHEKGHDPEYAHRIMSALALHGPVTPKKARQISGMMKQTGIRVAELQNFGEYLIPKQFPSFVNSTFSGQTVQ